MTIRLRKVSNKQTDKQTDKRQILHNLLGGGTARTYRDIVHDTHSGLLAFQYTGDRTTASTTVARLATTHITVLNRNQQLQQQQQEPDVDVTGCIADQSTDSSAGMACVNERVTNDGSHRVRALRRSCQRLGDSLRYGHYDDMATRRWDDKATTDCCCCIVYTRCNSLLLSHSRLHGGYRVSKQK